MSLITRCPVCQTMFRVVPDQLRISEGWVRCGLCEAEFDANLHMQESGNLSQATVQAESADNVPAQAIQADIQTDVPQPLSATTPSPGLAPEPMEQALETSSLTSEPDNEAPALPKSKEPTWDKGPSPVATADKEPAAQSSPGERTFTQAAIDITVPPGLSFVHEPMRQPLWHRKWVRAGLGGVALSLVLALALQIVLVERDRLAANSPALKPLIESLSGFFGYPVQPLRQIESIVIESSSFNKIQGDLYRLNLTIKNTANVELALPAIELSLTDTTDQPLMRRVFLSGEFGNPSRVIAPNSESVSSLALSIKANAATERISGYRVLAFYP